MTEIAEFGDGSGFGLDPLVRGMDPRFQIHTKMSRIRNTVKINQKGAEIYKEQEFFLIITFVSVS
jgi:hypothetical protein